MFERVLIVDDEKVLAESLADYLVKTGISTRIEIDPAAAIESFKVNPADLVIVDYKFASLSDKTGLDIIAEIRERKPSTRFVLISGWIPYDVSDPEVQNDLLTRLKVDGYFRKPFKARELGDCVTKLLATGATDWVSIANDYVGRGSVSASDVRELNEGYKKAILENLENPEEL